MGDYLNESPADFTSNSTTTNNNTDTDTPNFTYTNNFNYDSNSSQQQQQLQGQPLNFNFDSNANNSNQNEFSLNLNYSGYSGNGDLNTNVNNSTNSIAPSNSAYNSNSQLAGGQDYLSPMGFTSYNTASDPNTYGGGSNPGSFTNEPFLDDVAFSQAILGPQLQLQHSNSSPQPVSPHQAGQHFMNPGANSANLDELISPQNNDDSSFLNPQFFSPSNRGNNFNALGSIAEDNKNNLAFSPDTRKQSISGPSFNNAPDIQSGSYLSPQFNPPIASPGFDAGSYLNSPPPQLGSSIALKFEDSNDAKLSTSIPHPPVKVENWNALSPPPQTATLSSSVPSSSGNALSRDVPTKQLSKEEKMKRRREFHNAVERRRRDLIKERIKELGVIVPPSLLNPQLCAVQTLQRKLSAESTELNDLIGSIKVKETKPNKSTILNRSVDYINHLNYVLRQQEIARENLLKQIELLENANQPSNFGTTDKYQIPGGIQTQPLGLSSNNQTSSTSRSGGDAANYNPDDFFADIGTSTDNF
ncbi:Retrograde regulation protein 3 [Candida viswanathii]|uniref:Retrograde regulation protein 3 n=1 Tax=Candida viswanathii TaxID=5486 RepID=A0A367YE81_9ASCO|nr:Retrograde regulation protein 3 [Candida viswanathii]